MCQERDDVKRCEEPAILDWECFLFCGYHMLELNELKPGREENNPNIPPAEMRRLLKQYGHEFQPQAPPPSDISNKELRELFFRWNPSFCNFFRRNEEYNCWVPSLGHKTELKRRAHLRKHWSEVEARKKAQQLTSEKFEIGG